jgi:AAA+ superfamily predicted ATPase
MSLVRRVFEGQEVDICKRYRPCRMSEVVGCEATKRALTKAVEMGDSRPKAYLFYGERGCVTGSTRIRVRKVGEGETPVIVECSQPRNP